MDATIAIPTHQSIGGIRVGSIAFGCMRFGGAGLADVTARVETALDCGMNVLDTAPVYGSGDEGFGSGEAKLGEMFLARPDLRAETVLVTKAGIHPPVPYDSSRENLIQSCEASLRRLCTDRIDLFLIHRPDLLARFDEVAAALSQLRASGKIKEAGVSNFTHTQFRALQAKLDFPLVASQPEFSALHPEPLVDGVLDMAQEFNLATMAWSPLGGGRLVDRAEPQDDREARVFGALDHIGEINEVSRDVAALAWVLAHPANVVGIIGTQNLGRIRNAARATDVKIARRDWYAVLEAWRGEPMP